MVLVGCNFDMDYLCVLAGWEGSAHDGRVLNDAVWKDFPVIEGKYYLGDADVISPTHDTANLGMRRLSAPGQSTGRSVGRIASLIEKRPATQSLRTLVYTPQSPTRHPTVPAAPHQVMCPAIHASPARLA